MSDEREPEERREETWAYAGRRLQDGKVYSVWVDDEGRGKERWYAGRAKATVGYLYTVSVTRYTDDQNRERVSLYGVPTIQGGRALGPSEVADPRPEWHALDHAADVALQAKRLENAAAKAGTDLDKAIQPLLNVARGLRTNVERDALTAYVLRRMGEVRYVAGRSLG